MSPTIEARPTVYNGIQMRSRLEADYAASLDRSTAAGQWKYEPECFASSEGQWLPDFRTGDSGNTADTILIELKPAGRLHEDHMSGEIDKHLRRMMIAWASAPQVTLMLIYWQYEKSARMVIHASPDTPWLAQGGPLPLLWTGMGQYDAVTRQAARGENP